MRAWPGGSVREKSGCIAGFIAGFINGSRSGALWAIVMAAGSLTACARALDETPAYSIDQCRRVALVDPGTGASIIGGEDLALDPDGRRILVSAYDRRGVEHAIAKNRDSLAEGGIYALPIEALAGGATMISPVSLIDPNSVAGGLRPHGVSYDPARREIAFVNRGYQKVDGRWRLNVEIERADADGALFNAPGQAPRCASNDLAPAGERLVVSFDHADCGWRAAFEDLIAAKGGGVTISSGGAEFVGVRYANGVAALGDTRFALASTRDREVLVLREAESGLAVEKSISTPGGPDNLNLAPDGRIIAALHPSLFAIGAQRRLGLGRSASRIVSIDPASGDTRLLFDDPKAEIISAASSAIETDGLLVIGSALDVGIAVCRSGKAQ